ncbi:substrate-binding domain-containing protein [Herminiimonas sp. CN]|uniref:helix-turn-helix transcriptional regulator n=1 Tax=Herminiimonas sp. CN TaxID=1349818 RepID=UPI000473FAB5|nr:substrate-binding domain-containing protein [Herminiimonas sp. CN]
MLHLKLDYTFSATPVARNHLGNPLFEILAAIHRTGSISKTAQALELSYRHVWGALKNWEQTLGAEIIVWERGKRARLTPFGEKLLFAEQRAKARVLPQIENLIADMEREFALAFDRNAYVISLFASHDLVLNRLRDFMASDAKLHLDLQFRGSIDSLGALARGECLLAGFHISEDRARGTLTQQTFKKLLKPGKHKLITFLGRQQGLMVAAGNPKKIGGMGDLQRPGVRFINRETGSGTRLEIEQLLAAGKIDPATVNGFERCEATHLAVAAAVASGHADAGFGIRAAAMQFGLDFIPLMQEQYYLACLKETLREPAIEKLLALLQSNSWRHIIDGLPGYDASNAGNIVSLTQVMPWYSFKAQKEIQKTGSITKK